MPNADTAVIAPEKLRDYSMNEGHRRGGSKARVLVQFGYRADAWEVLEKDLRTQHLTADVREIKPNPFGQRYIIRAPVMTPIGRQIVLESVWQIDTGTDVPRLITLYPR